MSRSGSAADKAGAGSIGYGGVRERSQLVFCMALLPAYKKMWILF